MATLTGSTIAGSYDQLLALPSGGGNGATLVALTDGNAGNTFALKLSTGEVNSTGTLTVAGVSTFSGDIRLEDDAGGEYVGIASPSAVTTYTLTMPAAVGSSGQVLETSDGAGTLAWVTRDVGDITGLTEGTNISITSPTGPVPTINVDNPVVADLTGNCSGSAATVTGAAQTAITSVGTLTSLAVKGSTGVSFGTLDSGTLITNVDGHLSLSNADTGSGSPALSLVSDLALASQGEINGIYFGGRVNDTPTYAAWASIRAAKENTTEDNYAGSLRFYTNGASDSIAERMRIDSSGNVGIGTAVPAQLLHVASTANQVALIESTGSAYAELGLKDNTTSSGGVQLGAVGDAFYAIAGSAERMRIDSSGNVGIGDTTPTYKLDVNGTFRTTGAATFDGSVTATTFTGNVTGNCSGTAATVTGATQAAITSAANLVTVGTIGTGVWQGTAVDGTYVDIEGTEIKSTGESGATKFLREDGDGTCSWQAGGGAAIGTAVTGATEGSVLFAGSGGVLAQDNDKLFFDATYFRLGIGTAVPQLVALDVVEAMAVSGAVWTTGARAYSILIDDNTGNARFHAVGDASTQGSFDFYTATTVGGATSRMKISSAGLVGIGRTPATYELEVEGTIYGTDTANGGVGVIGSCGTTGTTGSIIGVKGDVNANVAADEAAVGYAVYGACSGNPATQYGIYGETAGTAVWADKSTTAAAVYGAVVEGPKTTAYGGYFTASDASSEGTGGGATATVSAYGVRGLAGGNATTNYGGSFAATGSSTTNYGGHFTASGATNNRAGVFTAGTGTIQRAIETTSGDVLFDDNDGQQAFLFDAENENITIGSSGTDVQLQQTVKTLADDVSVDIDFSKNNLQTVALTEDMPELTGSGYAAGRTVRLLLDLSGSTASSITVPTNWTNFGFDPSSSITGSGLILCELTSWTAAESGVTANWVEYAYS